MSPVPEDRQTPGGPNRGDTVEDMEMPPVNIALSSSAESDEDEDGAYQGYQLLPQDSEQVIANFNHGDAEDVDHEMASNDPDTDFMPIDIDSELGVTQSAEGLSIPPPPSVSEDVRERAGVWNQRNREAVQKSLDSDQTEQIKSLMSGFSLPTSQHPDWAKFVPEDDWKSHLISHLHSPSTNHDTDSQPKPT